jgi:hypothetical protein
MKCRLFHTSGRKQTRGAKVRRDYRLLHPDDYRIEAIGSTLQTPGGITF